LTVSRSVSIGSQSLASDLSDALDWVGPELQALVAAPGQAIHQAITNGLLVPRQGRRRTLDDTKRPMVDAATAALTAILGGDNLLVAAWRDLVAACRNIRSAVDPGGGCSRQSSTAATSMGFPNGVAAACCRASIGSWPSAASRARLRRSTGQAA
jgi:hypothetical protein